MARATKAEKARLLNAAYRLLGQRMERAEAARHLGREFALSRRQAYRYLQQAAGLSDPVPAVEPTVAVTFKLPVSTVTGNPHVRSTQRARPRPGRHPGGDGVAEQPPSATWVNDSPGRLCGRCIWITRSIDFSSASSPTPTRCWYRPARVRLPRTEWSVHMQMAAIYTRVSSDRQREAHTIASQTAALVEWAPTLDLEVPRDWVFEDDGYSGATLERPGLERVRDLAAAGDIQVVLVHSPDRLSRKYAYQVLLIEEFGRHGVETRFLNAPSSATAEDQLLVQFQGMIAEYERAQILRTVSAGETAPRASGRDQRHGRRPVWLSLSSEARRCTGLVRRRRGRSARRARHLRALHRHGLEHRGDLPVAQRARRGHSKGRGLLGALDGEADAAQPGLSRHGLLREDADSALPHNSCYPAGAVASQFLLPKEGRSRPPGEGPTTPLSVSCQPAPVLTAVKAHRYALPPLRGADGLDGGSAQARANSWPTGAQHDLYVGQLAAPSRRPSVRSS